MPHTDSPARHDYQDPSFWVLGLRGVKVAVQGEGERVGSVWCVHLDGWRSPGWLSRGFVVVGCW